MKNKQSQGGFSLIEVAIVVVIGGILLVGFANTLLQQQAQAKMDITKERIALLDKAIRNFGNVNFRYPCPAPLNARIDQPMFARQLPNCSAPAVAGQTASVIGLGPLSAGNTRIGAIPTRTLNLPDQYGFDGWGRKFIYAVDESDTVNTTFLQNRDAILIVDAANNFVANVKYLVTSSGVSRHGAYTNNGARPIPCDTARLDGENCDLANARFRTTLIADNRYDDFVSYDGDIELQEIPGGAVVAFNDTTCPPGWGLRGDLGGRFIIGAGTYNHQNPNTNLYGGGNITYNLGERLGSASHFGSNPVVAQQHRNLPPYLVLTYCEKL